MVGASCFVVATGFILNELFKKGKEEVIVSSEKSLVHEISNVLESFPCAEFKSEIEDEEDKTKFNKLKKDADKLAELQEAINKLEKEQNLIFNSPEFVITNKLTGNKFKNHKIEEVKKSSECELIARIMIEKYQKPEIKSHIKWDFINKDYKNKHILNIYIYLL